MKWDQIVSIRYTGEEHVYDLQIDNTHNFVGNSIVAHNTYISGNTGIGFSTPDRRLLISSDIDIVGSNASLLGAGGTQFSISGDSASGTQKKLTLGIDTTDNFGVIQAGSVGTNYALSLSPAGGNVGIGTTSTNATLSVVGNASIGGLYTGVSPPTNGLFVNGNLGIGATTSTNILDVWGNQRITGNLTLDGTCTGCVTASGWTDDGTVVRLTTITDSVGIGTTSPSQRLQINFSSSNPVVVTSGGNVGIGFTTPLSLLHVQGDGSTGSWSTNSNYLPTGSRRQSSVIANGYIYAIGGLSTANGNQSTVYYARINSDGSTGSWTTNTNYLPAVRNTHSSVVANGYVYVIGGITSTSVSTVFYAKLNSDGSTGTWNTNSNYLPGRNNRHSSVVANGYVYVTGGQFAGANSSTVLYAKLNADGSVGTWTTNSNYLPGVRSDHSSVVANGYLYVMGGIGTSSVTQSTVFYAKLNSDGSTGSWTTNSNYLPEVRDFLSSIVANGYVYVMGGSDDTASRSSVYYARLNSDGSLGTWTTNSNSLPAIRSEHSTVVANGYVYAIGGCDSTCGTGGARSTIYYAPLARVSIAADLDLLGIAGANVGDSTGDSSLGSVGGSIYAGNIFSAGALEVSGNTQLWSGLGVTGTLSVGVGTTAVPNVLASIQQGTFNLGTGVSAPSSLLQIAGDGSTGTWRTNSNYLPEKRLDSSSIVANGYVYVMGGRSLGSDPQSTVYYAKLNADGSLGSFTTNSNYLPLARGEHSSIVANGYVYVMGGCSGTCTTINSTIFYAKLNADGSTGTWNTNSNYLPAIRNQHSSIVANGYVYVIGGNDTAVRSSVFYARLNSDGSTGTWSTNSNSLPAIRYLHSSIVANGYVYVIGGCSGTCSGTTTHSTVYYAKLNADGSLGSFTTNSNYLPLARGEHSSIVANGYVYVMGGTNASNLEQSTVYYAKLNADGSLGSFTTNSNYLPDERAKHSSVVANGYVYVMGGQDVAGDEHSTVYYAPLARVSMAADLDLLGVSGGNVGDSTGDSSLGSVGGSIYAGNIFSAGALEVAGNSQFWSGAGFLGPVNIGVGASTPSTGAAFSITGNTSLTGPQLPFFNVLNNGNVGIGVSLPSATLQIASNATCLDGTNASTACSINDYAELYPALVPTEKGDVVTIDTTVIPDSIGDPYNIDSRLRGNDSGSKQPYVKPSDKPYQGTIVGIVTSDPAIVIEGGRISFMGGPTYEHDPYKPGVALAGRVPVKVSLENGPIEKGDYLTSSSTPGVAMKATKPGQVVGKALEPFGQKSEALNTKSETNSNDQNTNDQNSFEFRDSNFEFGRILVFVNVSYADPNDFFASLSFDNDGYLIIPKIKAGKLVLDSSIASQSATLSTNYQLPTTNYYNLSSKLASIEDRLAELEKVAENTSEVESPNTSEVELSLTTPDILLATGSASLTTGPSATLADLNTYSDATVSGMLVAYQAQIQDHFKVLGETILGNTLIAGDLTVDGTLSISGNSINALSTLYLQSSILAEGLDIFNGKVTIDKEGNISASTITLDQIKVRSGQSQGLSKILAGQTQNLVENPLVEASSIIFVNPKSQTEQTLAVSEKKQGGFLVKITHPEPFDIDFEYLTVRVKP